MEAAVWLPGPEGNVIPSLEKYGVSVRKVFGTFKHQFAFLVGLILDHAEKNEIHYRIPPELYWRDEASLQLVLVSSERRGENRKNGEASATIVCTAGGKALKPCDWTPGVANFAERGSLAVVDANQDGLITIGIYTLERTSYQTVVLTERVFVKFLSAEKLDGDYVRFKDAAEAATAKAKCTGCKHLHFVAE